MTKKYIKRGTKLNAYSDLLSITEGYSPASKIGIKVSSIPSFCSGFTMDEINCSTEPNYT